MRILIVSKYPDLDPGAARSFFPGGSDLEVLPLRGLRRSLERLCGADMVYLDLREIGEDGLRRHVPVLVESGIPAWGVLDPAGVIQDPAGVFFLGAKDYAGPAVLKAGIPLERLMEVRAFAGIESRTAAPEGTPGSFPGWNRLQEGTEVSVRFCYAALGDLNDLRERIGEKRLNDLREDFFDFMSSWAAECGGRAWMRDHDGALLVFPERDEGANPVLAAFRLLLDRALVGYEIFHLEVPLTFRFAFHAGRTVWRRPGSTGTVVSGDVNFIFHLGSKFGSAGRIVLSAAMEPSIPAAIRGLFVPAGDFEGRLILASRRFRD